VCPAKSRTARRRRTLGLKLLHPGCLGCEPSLFFFLGLLKHLFRSLSSSSLFVKVVLQLVDAVPKVFHRIGQFLKSFSKIISLIVYPHLQIVPVFQQAIDLVLHALYAGLQLRFLFLRGFRCFLPPNRYDQCATTSCRSSFIARLCL
jgi:hypothetical protein